MVTLKQRVDHSHFKTILTGITIMPIIAILGFLNVIPVSNTVAWLSLAGFFISLFKFFFTFKGRNPAKDIN
ncbi:hypothetical protein [Alkalicoccobacillus gibsonii]|uniref:hypothetical protein n=1 Tax=Alkalicoccobacillus gibsonii TaxID=79881 RepID=UPI003512DD8B